MNNKCRTNNWFSCWRTLCYSTLMAVVVAFTLTSQAFAGVANNGLFELDANPQDPNPAVAPDDWATPPNAGGALKFTGIVDDPAPKSIFDGGKKDIQDLNLSHKKKHNLFVDSHMNMNHIHLEMIQSRSAVVSLGVCRVVLTLLFQPISYNSPAQSYIHAEPQALLR